MMTLRSALQNYLAKRSPQGLAGGPPFYNNPGVKDVPDNTRLLSRYVTDMDIHGEKLFYPTAMLLVKVAPTVAEGTSVYITGYDKDRDGPTADAAIPGMAGKWPSVGVVKLKIADDIAVVPVAGLGEFSLAGAKGGDLYVTGTDGMLAKKGDANFPAAGTDTLLQGVGIADDTIMLVGQLPWKT